LQKVFYRFTVWLYQLGIRLVSPWNTKARLWLQGRKQFPVFNHESKPCIWVHCASLGEFEQGRPVLEALKNQYPNYPVMLSFFSPSGYEVRKNYPGADTVFYLPSDSPGHAEKLINTMNPALVIWVKYEYWYYYLSTLYKKGVPVLLISGIFRPSQPFFKWYGAFWRKMLVPFQLLFVQNYDSYQLLKSIGITNGIVAGDTRFDRVVEIAEKKKQVPHIESFTENFPVVVAGSTWEEDEVEWMHFVRMHPGVRFIFAPHVVTSERINAMKKTFPEAITYSQLSANAEIAIGCHILIIDNIGMLSALYQYAQITYIGGGFGNDGIHNTLEAAVYGKPVVFGPEYQKFAEAVELVKIGAAFPVSSAIALEKIVTHLLNQRESCEQAGKAARQFVYQQKGATETILAYVAEKRLLTN
jgi:3-deoxy-D-manno-octulosonic-acid transferase